jgi:hypothetical protein
VRGVRRGRLPAGHRHVAAPLVLAAQQGALDVHPLRHGGSGAPRHHPRAVGLIGTRRAHRWQVLRAVSLLAVREALSACARPMPAASAPVTGGPPRGGIAIGVGAQPATASHRHVRRVERIVFGLTAGERLHREGVAEATGQLCLGAAVGAPGPGQEAVASADPSLPRGGHGLEQRRRTGVHLVLEPARAVLVAATQVQAARLPINAALRLMVLGVEAPEVSSS